MPDINVGDAVPFEQLQSADLVLGCVYRGGTAGSVADDPLNRLIPVGNAGGFRYKGSSEAPLLIALYTTGAEDDWPDSLDPLTSTFTYYGDNRTPGRHLLDTPRHGNEILRRTFERAHGDPRARAQVAPHLLFAEAGQGRDVVFRGLLAPGAQTLTASEDLVVIAHDRQGLELRNYQAKFTVLDARHVTRAWLNDVLAGEPLSGNCPDAWREWVTRLAYQPLARFPQDAEERAARAEFDAQSGNDPPISDEDARRRLQREIFARQGQSDFRESLIRAYRGQCAVTGCAVLPVLEAAHLRPYRGAHTNVVTNGLPLRADIHTLLDYKLWAPEPGTRAIAISRLLIGTPYNEISGRKIVEPATPAQRPADSVLEKVWREFRQAETKRQQHLDHDSTPTAEMHDRCRTPHG
ncbi:MAG: HNH endonuclease [Streptosporangiaceae bacterium]